MFIYLNIVVKLEIQIARVRRHRKYQKSVARPAKFSISQSCLLVLRAEGNAADFFAEIPAARRASFQRTIPSERAE
jgi:hypothetical protein